MMWRNQLVEKLEQDNISLHLQMARQRGEIEERYEKQIDRLIARHDEFLATIQSLHQTIQYEAMRELTELKKAHAAELQRVINEHEGLKDEYQRVLRLLHPAMQAVELPKERSAIPPPPDDAVVTGTPWQRVQKMYAIQQEQDAKNATNFVKPVEGDPNGSSSERRIDASLGGTGKAP